MSLLNDGSEAQQDNPGSEHATNETINQDSAPWYWDENTPGQGERPSFLPEKYKTVADVAKAQRELESRLGQAPNQYDFSKGESWIEPDYEPFQQMAEFAKQHHVPQAVFDKFLDTVGLYLDEFKPDIEDEKSKLGEKASERLQVLNNWAKSNLSDKAYNALTTGMRTAEQIEALEEIRSKMVGSNTMIPNSNAGIIAPGMTIEEYRSELNANFKKYKEDPVYRKEMERKLENIVGRGK